MASGSDKSGDDTYDSALQRLMKECLPPILVEIADKRPSDPIQFMAQSLYKYREKEDAALFNTQSTRFRSAVGNSVETIHSKSESKYRNDLQPEHVRQRLLAKGMIVESKEDFIDVSEDFDVFNISNKMVHEQCMVAMKLIGDIFDEDDIS